MTEDDETRPFTAEYLFQLLRSLELPRGDHAVFGSGPLLVRGIIDSANDLDVVCRGAAWRQALRSGPLVHLPDHDVDVVQLHGGAITLGNRWAIGNVDVDDLIATAELLQGIPFVRLEHVIAYKRFAGRPKDLYHLRLIDAFHEQG